VVISVLCLNPVRLSVAVGVCMAFTLAGCATSKQLQLTASAAPQTSKTTAAVGREINLLPVIDSRSDPAALGRVAGTLFTSDDASTWLANSIQQSLLTEGYVFSESASFSVQTRILKLYVDSIDIAKTAVLVLEVKFSRADGRAVTRIYRGQQVGINWASGEGEVLASLRKCLTTCLREMIKDVRELSHPANDGLWRD
jgi:uncharacterized lipoprotein YajG